MHVSVCTGREPRHYLNGSHFRVCHHFSEAAISMQTDTYTDRLQADRQTGREAGGWGGVGGQAGCRGRQAQLACSTQGYVLPEVEN